MRSARFLLRDATASWHERVDALFSNTDLADPRQYGGFLLAQAAAHLAVEQALDRANVAEIVSDWPERRRGNLIRLDLATLGEQMPVLEVLPALTGTAAKWGALYVLEGSRLGGKILARSVGAGLPTSYLAAGRPVAWRELTTLIDRTLTKRPDIDNAAEAACAVFALFERSGRRLLRNPLPPSRP
jgi:heme oxygenase